jgi:hypothetical protein
MGGQMGADEDQTRQVIRELCAWSARQPEAVQSRADIVIGNLRHLMQAPHNEMLLAVTMRNIAKLTERGYYLDLKVEPRQ